MSKPTVFLSNLTGRAYYSSDYREDRPGHFVAASKQDVTESVVHDLMARAWARGWNECNAAPEGASPPNPYRPAARIDQADEAAKEDTTPMSETSEQKPCGRGICLRESGHGGTCDEASFGVAPEQRRHYLKGDDCSCGFAAGLGSTCTCQPVTSEDAS